MCSIGRNDRGRSNEASSRVKPHSRALSQSDSVDLCCFFSVGASRWTSCFALRDSKQPLKFKPTAIFSAPQKKKNINVSNTSISPILIFRGRLIYHQATSWSFGNGILPVYSRAREYEIIMMADRVVKLRFEKVYIEWRCYMASVATRNIISELGLRHSVTPTSALGRFRSFFPPHVSSSRLTSWIELWKDRASERARTVILF
jgi:hypothetical protein